MSKFLLALIIAPLLQVAHAAPARSAGPVNPILFVTQVPIPEDFTTIASVFGSQRSDVESCGRGGDLYIRYPNGTLRNLTRAAGYGSGGMLTTNGIAVRQPCVYWDGTKAIFSMVIGGPLRQFDISQTNYWQLYEITNFLDPSGTPVITLVPNQPRNFNNISPIYGTDDRIIFTTDRPRNGQPQLYPQLDEYEEAPTVTGLWSLNPATGDLFMMQHSPSGSFSPFIDSAGRVIFERWDHLQRDQQADADNENQTTNVEYGTFDWSDESASSIATTNRFEVFPGPRYTNGVFLPHTFNQFFPWQINEDGTAEETVNHVGRHELGGSYISADRDDDPNIQDLYNFAVNYNTNRISNFTEIREDAAQPGRLLAVDAPEFATHNGGQLVALTANTNLTADFMLITYLTPRATADTADDPANPPADHTGFYRNPLGTTDGWLIASHTSWTGPAGNIGTDDFPAENYDFRLKLLVFTNGFYVPGTPLTPGITNNVSWWSPDELVTITNQALWEFDPVEVVARPRPARRVPFVDVPETAMFAKAGVDITQFQNWLKLYNLAVLISRDVTTRDHADFQQPFNLQIDGTAHETIGKPGIVYPITWLQFFQADQLRSLNHGDPANPLAGRRVLAREMHDPVPDNPPVPTNAPVGSVRLGVDGSMAAFVPARRAMSWQLTDTNGGPVVRERYWLTFQPGEIRTCTSCHGINTHDQAGNLTPTNSPEALLDLLNYWKARYQTKNSLTNIAGNTYLALTFDRRLAASNLTYAVQYSTNLANWLTGSTYSDTTVNSNSAVTTQLSRNGATNETITVRGNVPVSSARVQYLRVKMTSP